MAARKRANNYLLNNKQKSSDRATWTPQKYGGESGAPEGLDWAMTSTQEKCRLIRIIVASADELYPENHCIGCNLNHRIAYELLNVTSIHWWCYWNIATDKLEVDYWASEVIMFVIEFCFIRPPLSISSHDEQSSPPSDMNIWAILPS
jgi:hypothetical protein